MSHDESPVSSDEDLVIRTRAGDTDALRLLLGRYERSALNRIRRRLPGSVLRKVDPEDVLQGAFLVAATRLSDFVPEGDNPFGRWFATIVAMKIKETLRQYIGTGKRSAAREVTRGARPDTAFVRGSQATPSLVAHGNERAEAARRALDRMDEGPREVLDVVQFQGVPLRDAAHRFGCSYEAMKKRYARALDSFREALGEEVDLDDLAP